MKLTNQIKQLHDILAGHQSVMSLQARLFHTICIALLVFMPATLFVNLFLNMPHVTMAISVAVTLIGLLYYNSRYLGNLRWSVVLFGIILYGWLTFNYFVNSGINGPTLLLFLVAQVLIIAVMPRSQYYFWLPLNALLVIGVVAIEYFYPASVVSHYSLRLNLFTDVLTTYVCATASIAVVFYYVIRNYQAEKKRKIELFNSLKKADESKAKFLSILSHDLKSPLNSIQSFLEMLTDYDLAPEEEKMIKTSLLKETRNTQIMLFNMLSWTKAQMEGGIRVSLVPVNVSNDLESSIDLFKVAAMDKMITLSTDIDDDVCLHADMDMITLVIRNLVNNAIKFTNTGGEIMIRAKIVNGDGVLSVEDNGIGISKEKQLQLFELNSGTTYGTNNEKGVGLGLMLCKEFTELQGGKLSFTSTEGKGSAFSVSLPICAGAFHSSATALEEVH
ncbi:MAG: HAMP domain-containing sensor histidine kinase [Pedobacter sp.]|uniref:sensor histidine kinase n=1 Tax=Pedobacter sp. TaxID=1411316 RepID=UPI003395EDE5